MLAKQKQADDWSNSLEQVRKSLVEHTKRLSQTNQKLEQQIAERLRAETALRQAEIKYRSIFENAVEGIFQTTPQGQYLSANPALAHIYGYDSPEELIVSLTDISQQLYVDPDRRQQFMTAIHQEQAVFKFESEVYRKDGSIIWVSENARAVFDHNGHLLYYEGTVEDITDRKQAEAALRQSEARLRERTQQLEQTVEKLKHTQLQLIQTEKMSSLGQLVAGVAHEINNPVSFIYGNLIHASDYVQTLVELVQAFKQEQSSLSPTLQSQLDGIDLDFLSEDLPKLFSSMHSGASRIREIVLSLRNFSRLDEAEMKQVDIHQGLDSTLLILQNRLNPGDGHPSIQVTKEYSELPLVECYAGQLNQVFMHILSNAIDAIEARLKSGANLEVSATGSPQIWIRTQIGENNTVQIRIGDNGTGMSEDIKQHLFDFFFTTKPVGKGTGLGLSISYQIVVEQHHGQLACNSTLGEGSEFVITIPTNPSLAAS